VAETGSAVIAIDTVTGCAVTAGGIGGANRNPSPASKSTADFIYLTTDALADGAMLEKPLGASARTVIRMPSRRRGNGCS
jgi:hypothetical protein